MDTEYLNETVETLASLHLRAQHGVSRHQRGVEFLTAQVGQPRSLYVLVGCALGWAGTNLLLPRLGVHALDPPPFPWLQGLVGLCALLMTITILTTQNRLTRQAEQRAQLDLQINLLAERKIAKIIALVEELRRDMPTVKDRVDRVAEVMKEPVDPHAVLSALEQTLEGTPSAPRASEPPAAPSRSDSARSGGR